MLDNLVESKNNSRAVRKLYGFLLSTFFVISAMLLSATVWSLFAKDFGVGNSEFELSNLLTPIPVADEKPEEIKPEKPKQQNEPQNAKSELPSRQSVMAKVDEPQIVPEKTSTAPNTQKARPNSPFKINPNGVETDGSIGNKNGRTENSSEPVGFKEPTNNAEVIAEKTKIPEPPPVLKKPEEKPKVTTISLGVVNGKAANLPKPPYPPAAKAVNASGAVNVQVLIDENGNVVSAKAVSGHPLLRDAAERAACNARFTPTKLSNIPVKVNGLIIYNFTK